MATSTRLSCAQMQEELVVPQANAVAKPWTVVVHAFSAVSVHVN